MSNKESREESTSESEQDDEVDSFVFMGREAKPLTPEVTVERTDEETED